MSRWHRRRDSLDRCEPDLLARCSRVEPSLEQISAVVHSRFEGQQIEAASEQTATIVTGALLPAYAVADDATAGLLSEHGKDWPGQSAELVPPWKVTSSALLDPASWTVSTALVVR